MPFDGSGNFTRDYNFVDDRNNGIKVVAARVDGEFDNYAGALNQVLLRNGVTPLTGNFQMGQNLLTGLGDGSVTTPAIQFDSDPTTGVFKSGFGKMAWTSNGIKRIEATTLGVDVFGVLTTTGGFTTTGPISAASLTGLAAGTAAAPAVSFAAPPGTGMYMSTPGVVSFSSAGAQRLDIHNTGVDVIGTFGATGTTGLGGQVNVVGPINFVNPTGEIKIAGLPAIYIDSLGNMAFGTSLGVPNATVDVQRPGATAANVQVRNAGVTTRMGIDATSAYFGTVTNSPTRFTTGNVTRMTIDAAGRVGIGGAAATTPQATLHVREDGAAEAIKVERGGSNTHVAFYANGARRGVVGSDGGDNMYIASDGVLDFHTVGNFKARMDAGGNLGLGVVPIVALDVFRPGVTTVQSFVRNANVTGHMVVDGGQVLIGSSTNHNLVLRTADVGRVWIDGSGNMGVGAVPGTAFDVYRPGAATVASTVRNDGVSAQIAVDGATAYVGTTSGSALALRTNGIIRMQIGVGGVITEQPTGFEIGYKDAPQDAKTGSFTYEYAHRGRHVFCTGAAANNTIPSNASVPFPVGARITTVNDGPGIRTIVQSATTLKMAGTGATGDRSLASGGVCHMLKVATDTWYIWGFGLT